MTSARGDAPRGPVLAVVGASGAVGSSLRKLLATRDDVWSEVRLLGSRASAGRSLPVLGKDVTVAELTLSAFDGVDVAIFAVPAAVSRHWVPPVAELGVVVVDVSPAFQADLDVPVIAPDVNPGRARGPRGRIIALAGCTSIPVLDALSPLSRRWGLTSVVVTSCLAASIAGRGGIERLADETAVVAQQRGLGQRTGDVRAALSDALPGGSSPFEAPLALNMVPFFGDRAAHGWACEEADVRRDLRRVLGLPSLNVSATCLMVPVVTSHTVIVHATFQSVVDVGQARRAILEAPGIVLIDAGSGDDLEGGPDGDGDLPTPVDAVGVDPAWAGRVRQDEDDRTSLDMVLCSDNLRAGSALTAARVAELAAASLAGEEPRTSTRLTDPGPR